MKVKPIVELRYIFDRETFAKCMDVKLSDDPMIWYNVCDQKVVGTDPSDLRYDLYIMSPNWCKEEIVYQDDERYYFDKQLLFEDIPIAYTDEENVDPDEWFNEYDGCEVVFIGKTPYYTIIGFPIKNGHIVKDILITQSWVNSKIKSVE